MTGMPTRSEIETALERILASRCFARAQRARGFLRFVTEETLAGRANEINGYRIAIGVFAKPHDFDAGNDPLVRAEARRVRSRLCEYFATSGAHDPVRIELKPGSYVPVFRYASAEAMRTNAAAEASAPTRAGRRLAWGLVAAAALGSALFAAGLSTWWSPPHRMSETAQIEQPHLPAPRILVEPFATLGAAETAHLALGITEEVMTRLGKYRYVSTLVAPEAIAPNAAARSATNAAQRADFLLSGTVFADEDSMRVEPRLVDTRSGRLIWSASYEQRVGADGLWQVVDSMAGAVAAAAGEPYGPLFDAEVARGAFATAADPYHCLLRFVFALQVISEAAHARATTCFENVVATEPSSAVSYARLAALYRMEYLHAFNTRPDAPPPLERALDAARRALELDPRNPFASQEMAFLSLLQDDRAEFERWVERTLALDPSADVRAALGINFVKMGEVERGLALIDRSIAESPRAPPFFFLGYVVQSLRAQDYDEAHALAQRMTTPEWPLSQAMLAATAALAGDAEHARSAAERLLELRPDFARTGRDLIARGRLGEDVERQLAYGLALAGLSLECGEPCWTVAGHGPSSH